MSDSRNDDVLKEAVSSASEAVYKLESEIRERQRVIECEFSAALDSAKAALYQARAQWQEFRDAEALAEAKPPYPVGTKLAQWERCSEWNSTETKKVRASGVTGVLEIITRDSEHPANLSKYSRASVGSCVVRLLKKNGETGSKYIVPGGWHGGDWAMWRPVGVDLNAEFCAAEIAKVQAARRGEEAKKDGLLRSAVEVFGL